METAQKVNDMSIDSRSCSLRGAAPAIFNLEPFIPYYARFESVKGRIFRLDTRIYLDEHNPAEVGVCVGAIVAKNLGSAKSRQLSVLASLKQAEKALPFNSYVQVWNLFYLCGPDLQTACATIRAFDNPTQCLSENNEQKVIWFAWGDNDRFLNPFKSRFLVARPGSFYYNPRLKLIVSREPLVTDFAKHPQGLLAKPVVDHLACVL